MFGRIKWIVTEVLHWLIQIIINILKYIIHVVNRYFFIRVSKLLI